MREKLKMVTGWIHTTLIFSLLFPTIYSIGMEVVSSEQIWIYLLNLFLILPVAVTELAILYCKTLIGYLLSCSLSIIAAGTITFGIGNILSSYTFSPSFVPAIIMGESIYIIIYRFIGRLHNKKMEMVYEDSEESKERYDMLTNPGFTGIIFFLLSYIIGIFFNNKFLCNEAFFSCILYFFTVIVYQHLNSIENYLFINGTIQNVPKKRIWGISQNMILILIILLFVASIPSILTVSNRNYHDARNLLSKTPYSGEVWEEPEINSTDDNDEFYKMLEEMTGESLQLPWLEPLTNILIAVIFFILGIYVLKYINKTQRIFREAYDENGDIVEDLDMTSSLEEERILPKKWNKRNLSPREKIRYDYYLFIKKYRREMPLPHETPYEIEKAANIAELEETKHIHDKYEQARYDK
ncbi:MAG: hypothetical protein ACI4F9_02050 [Lachnospiraceae bacterium]